MIRATFFMEQHIGHRTYYQNLRNFVDADPELSPTWIEVTYQKADSIWNQLPLLPANIRGTLIGRQQVHQGLKKPIADVALFNTQVPAALAGRNRNKQPYILCTDITPRQYDRMGALYGHHPDRNRLIRYYKHRANVKLFQLATRILPWSTWAANSLQQDYHVEPEKIEVIPPGVDVQRWRPADRDNEGPLRILFIGGDFYRKGGQTLLRAFQQLPPGTAKLILVTRSSLPAQAGVTIYNHMQPNTPELIALCQSCDLFVLPTEAEAFGIAAVEASAVGLPVIATRVGGLEGIVADGETGFLIPAGDYMTLAERICFLIENSNQRQRMKLAARTRAETVFDARKNAGRIIDIIKEIDGTH